jgi:transposase
MNPKGRSLELHPYRAVLAERRKEAQQPDFWEKQNPRAGIEASISELVRRYHVRYCRYRGIAKLRLQSCFTAIAANLKRLARWWARQAQLKAQAMGS